VRVLIVDDEPIVRRPARGVADGLGLPGRLGLERRAGVGSLQQADPPALAILDWTMPGMDGLELCTKVRAMGREPKPYLIFVTAKARTQDIVTGLGAGADDYIVKPFEREEAPRAGAGRVPMLALQAAVAEPVRELEEALTRVKQLQGLLPICSYCKKVRGRPKLLAAGRDLHRGALRRPVHARDLSGVPREVRRARAGAAASDPGRRADRNPAVITRRAAGRPRPFRSAGSTPRTHSRSASTTTPATWGSAPCG